MTSQSTLGRCGAAFILALWLFGIFLAHAETAVPPLVGHVTDITGTLSREEKSELEQALASFEARKGAQLAVLIVQSTGEEAIEQYALRVVEAWKLGRKKVDDGVILLVVKGDRTVRIEVGYGLEGALSDITSKRIISEMILPRFKQSDYFGGIQSGTQQIMRIVEGESLPSSHNNAQYPDAGIRQYLPFFLFLSLSVGGVMRHIFGRMAGSLLTSIVVSGLAWLVLGSLAVALFSGLGALFATLMGAASMFHGIGAMGGGNRYGSSGGGFRGGGGGFGGGGASGRW